MDHTSYEKMPHSSASWKFAGASNNPSRVKWCVTEKVHGANFCFHCDGKDIIHAKRTALLDANDEFFGYDTMASKIKQQIMDAYNIFTSNKSMMKRYNKDTKYEISHLSIYGELFGGFYPMRKDKNDTSKKKKKNKKNNQNHLNEEKKSDYNDNDDNNNNFVVQREILYSPNIEFYAFDIAVTLKDNENQTRRQYVNYEDAISIFESVKLFYAKPLFIGKYEDCCNYSYEFVSNIPKWLGLPILSKDYGKNLAEGIVIKPMKNIYISGKGGKLKRAIVKHKHKSFNERISNMNSKYGKFDNRDNGNAKDIINTELLVNMVNDNRYKSVVSKHGNPSWNNNKGKKKKSSKKSKNQNININEDNFYVKAIVDDVYDDINNDKRSSIYEWYHKNVTSNDKLKKYIHNKLIQKSIEVVMNNKQ